jgi:hypothetical protein
MSVRIALPALAAVAALALGAPSVAEACSCLEPSLSRSWHEASDTVRAVVVGERTSGQFNYYEVEVQRVFSGCTQAGDTLLVESYRSEATCGIQLQTGTSYLLTATAHPGPGGRTAYQVGLCGFNKPWAQVTSAEKGYLASRPVYCERTDELTCADGTDPVECLVDPCSVADCPNASRCESNYCGGCTAEFYDDLWAPECRPW